ncbi:MAG: hypothetical protein U0105_09560 [Candidatus Obscuribacterales bacterium]
MKRVALICCLASIAQVSNVEVSIAAPDKTPSPKTSEASKSADAKALIQSAEQFLHEYYAAADKVSSLVDLDHWYSKSVRKHKPEDAEKTVWLVQMHRSLFPSKVKIVSYVQPRNDTLVFTLTPLLIPASFEKQSKEEGFEMTGTLVLVREAGQWKVHRDIWTVTDFSRTNDRTYGIDGDL